VKHLIVNRDTKLTLKSLVKVLQVLQKSLCIDMCNTVTPKKPLFKNNIYIIGVTALHITIQEIAAIVFVEQRQLVTIGVI